MTAKKKAESSEAPNPMPSLVEIVEAFRAQIDKDRSVGTSMKIETPEVSA